MSFDGKGRLFSYSLVSALSKAGFERVEFDPQLFTRFESMITKLAEEVGMLLATGVGPIGLEKVITALLVQSGFENETLTESAARILWEEYFDRLQAVRAQDLLADLAGAISTIREISRLADPNGGGLVQLLNTLNKFINTLPNLGKTGEFNNLELKCLACIGKAAVHQVYGSPLDCVTKSMAEAVEINDEFAQKLIGKEICDFILQRMMRSDRVCLLRVLPPPSDWNPELIWYRSGTITAFWPDGENLTCIYGRHVCIWNVRTWESRTLCDNSLNMSGLREFKLSPDGQTLVGLPLPWEGENLIKVWSIAENMNEITTLKVNRKEALGVAFDAFKQILAISGRDSITVYLLPEGDPVITIKAKLGLPRKTFGGFSRDNIAFSAKNHAIFGVTHHKSSSVIKKWDLLTGKLLNALPEVFTPNPYGSLTLSPDENVVIEYSVFLGIMARKLDGGEVLYKKFVSLRDSPICFCFTSDGRILLCLSNPNFFNGKPLSSEVDSALHFWDANSGRVLRSINLGPGGKNQYFSYKLRGKFTSVSVSPDNKFTSVSVSPDKRTLALGARNGEIQVWSVPTNDAQSQ